MPSGGGASYGTRVTGARVPRPAGMGGASTPLLGRAAENSANPEVYSTLTSKTTFELKMYSSYSFIAPKMSSRGQPKVYRNSVHIYCTNPRSEASQQGPGLRGSRPRRGTACEVDRGEEKGRATTAELGPSRVLKLEREGGCPPSPASGEAWLGEGRGQEGALLYCAKAEPGQRGAGGGA